ncbi:MAG: choice-of-anchor U domain-containing protein [Ghiorsea sp.]|nr:choice-of-anchor U domain-containing protein [Ghiorsea sp.]
MFKLLFNLTLITALTTLMQTQALAWEQHVLPASFNQSSTPHYGGNKAPLVFSTTHIQTITPTHTGLNLWDSQNDGIHWTPTLITSNTQFTQAYLASNTLALAWGYNVAPTMFRSLVNSASWSASSHVWPLASWNIIHVSTSTNGDLIVLATTPDTGKLVEGELFMIRGNTNGWSNPTLLSQSNRLVGDATHITHLSGLQSIVWSERTGTTWQVVISNSSDGITWSTPNPIVQNIAAPYFQETAVHIAADALNNGEIALAFTGWSMQVHSQVWSKAFDAISGVTTQPLTLLPDAGDTVVQPSLVSLANNTWAVAWQQKKGIDSEIYVAQHHADGTWSHAVNVSMDPMHMDRDPHIAQGSSKTLNIAFTRRIQADVQEVYVFAEGDVLDASLDSDGDGVADSQEQGFDLDHDGIDDAQSARIATWANNDGRYALIIEGNGELRQVQAPAFTETHIQAPATHQVSGSLFSFQIHALNLGETTQVHVLTPHTLANDTTWLKLNPNAQWSDSESNTVFRDASGKGLIISLTDGGAGDEDGISDGIIIDPAVLATPQTAAQSTTIHDIQNTEAAAGCLLESNNNPYTLYIMFILLAGIALQKRLRTAHL